MPDATTEKLVDPYTQHRVAATACRHPGGNGQVCTGWPERMASM